MGWEGVTGLASSSSVDRSASAAFSKWAATIGSSSSPDPDARKTESGEVMRGGAGGGVSTTVGLGTMVLVTDKVWGCGGLLEGGGASSWRSECLERCLVDVCALVCLDGSSGDERSGPLSDDGGFGFSGAPGALLGLFSGCSDG